MTADCFFLQAAGEIVLRKIPDFAGLSLELSGEILYNIYSENNG